MCSGASCSAGGGGEGGVAYKQKRQTGYDKRAATIRQFEERHTTCSTVHSFKTLKMPSLMYLHRIPTLFLIRNKKKKKEDGHQEKNSFLTAHNTQ